MNDYTIAFSKGYFLGTNDDAVNASVNVNLFSESLNRVMEFQNQLMRFGYMLDENSLKYLGALRPNHLEEIRKTTLDFLKESVGDGNFKTLFGSFPAVVNSMTEWEMFVFTMLHYLSGGTFVPSDNDKFQEYMKTNRGVDSSVDDIKAVEDYCKNFKTSYKMIKFFNPKSTNEFFDTLVKPLLISGTSITGYDKEVIEYFAKATHVNLAKYINSNNIEIPFKENQCMLAAYCPDMMLKTVTDVLRFTAYISNCTDLTLNTNPVFKNFTRSERRNIINRLEYVFQNSDFNASLAEMKGKINYWIRLGEKIHVGDYAKKYVQTFNAFTIIRNSAYIVKTFNSRYNNAYKNGTIEDVLNVLVERPGEYARHLDAVIRKFGNEKENFDKIVSTFTIAVKSVSMKVLYELIEHFNNRTNNDFLRSVKLSTSSHPIVLKDLEPMNGIYANTIVNLIYNEIAKRYSEKDPIEGDYIISTALDSINLPKDMRTKSFSIGQMTRGTGIPFNNKTGVIRCYLRWHDECGIEDLDISGTFFSDDLTKSDCVSWCSGYKKQYSVFSGDVRFIKGDVAEYVDIDVKKAITQGMRYLVVRADDYERHKFENDAWCGVMELPKFNADDAIISSYGRKVSSDNFEWLPAAVTTGFKISGGKSDGIIVSVIDLYDNMIYVVDDETSNKFVGRAVAARNTASQEYAVKLYAKHRPYMNALKVIGENFEKRCKSYEFLSETDIDNYLNRRIELEKEYKVLIESAEKEIEESKKTVLKELAENIKSNNSYYFKPMPNIIRFADIAFDYNKLLEYMF